MARPHRPLAFPETGYGLGKSGWISATFADDGDLPVDMIREWIDESYRAVAPVKLLATLDAGAAPKTKVPKARRPKAT